MLDDPRDGRRFLPGGDSQIAGVGDRFQRNSPPWIETMKSVRPDLPVYGSLIEASECLTRLIGQVNAMQWMAEFRERMGAVIRKVGALYLQMARVEIEAGAGPLDGLVIWGDVAYKKGTFMSVRYWPENFKPWVAQMVATAHAAGRPVIYHGGGNVKAISSDYPELGGDAYNPVEAKAGMDVVDLRQQHGHRIAFSGNSDIQVWETGDCNAVRHEVLRKLDARKGGDFIFQADDSVSRGVSGHTYD